ncbi:TIGR01212 family radical SAM protein [Flavobacterium sp. RSSB_23]|uniref:TIGR01212 family radical SAM protein n=1 Tax=Flavobacterium sp. RSSB_23 TaxID=3447668 RepID=UPI003F3B7519
MGTSGTAERKGYNNYGTFLREKYNGQKVYKVIVDAGFSCPNRDGSKGFGGCTYCNTDSFTPELSRKLPSITEQVLQGIERAQRAYKAERFIIYFQPNTNTYGTVEYLKKCYDEALAAAPDVIVGLSVGTRPDCLDADKVALLESYCDRWDVDVEMGMESIYDTTLQQINRGCSHQEFVDAVGLFANSPIDLCIHTVFGFPGETNEMMLQYVHEINRFPQIKFVKFHHLHIVEGSILGVHYKRNPFPLFTLEEYTNLLCQLIPLLRPDIIIQRLFGISDWDLLIAPNWGLKKTLIQNYMDKEIASRNIIQGAAYDFQNQ